MGAPPRIVNNLTVAMVKYMKKQINLEHAWKAKGSNLRVSFKNTRETANAIRGKSLPKAMQYLKDVIEKKQAVPFRIHKGGRNAHKQAHMHHKASAVGWPTKSCKFLLNLLTNVESNAAYAHNEKRLDFEPARLRISHIAVSRAANTRRRIFRAHGRINGALRQSSRSAVPRKRRPKRPARQTRPKKRPKRLP